MMRFVVKKDLEALQWMDIQDGFYRENLFLFFHNSIQFREGPREAKPELSKQQSGEKGRRSKTGFSKQLIFLEYLVGLGMKM